MRRIWVLCIILLCLSSLACSDDSSGANNANEDVLSDVSGVDTNAGDAKDDVDPHVDAVAEDTRDDTDEDVADAAEDANAIEADAVEAEDATDAVEGDTAEEDTVEEDAVAEDSVAEDATDVSFEDPYEGRPPGQCTTSSECPGEMTVCHVSFPGGSCATCVNDSDCPSGRTCNIYRACVTECSSNEECPLGLRCLSSGQCAALPCSSDSDCPVLYACADVLNQCERIDCSADATVCPGGTTCSGGRCMEDRQL